MGKEGGEKSDQWRGVRELPKSDEKLWGAFWLFMKTERTLLTGPKVLQVHLKYCHDTTP